MNTLNELKNSNLIYDEKYGINEWDIEKVQSLIPVIENSRSKLTPQCGDIVQFTNKYGDYHAFAHIDSVTSDQLYICEKPYIPFVEINSTTNRINTSTSGGAWFFIPKDITYVGTSKKDFQTWGHNGGCADGTLHFTAEVSVWEYTVGEHQFTTKTHDKYRVCNYEHDKDKEYNYMIYKGANNLHFAFKTKGEYDEWLKTFNGVEYPGSTYYDKVVWTYKHMKELISLEKYVALENAIVDSFPWNGKYYECKRVVENTIITTYMPSMKDKIEVNK